MMSERDAQSRSDRALLLLASLCVMFALLVVVRLVLGTRTGTVDSYYYFARTEQLTHGVPLRETTINWSGGVDRKFFPGYPLLLSWFSFGSLPERAWRTLSVVLALLNPVLIGVALRRLGLSVGAASLAVAMFVTNFVAVNWFSMPMAESTAVLWLALSAIALPAPEDRPTPAMLKFLLACALGGLAIQCRAEAAYTCAAIGLVGLSRIRGKSGWLPVLVVGMVLGVVPFLYWATSLPSSEGQTSRLHYVNEFIREFSWLDREDVDGKGGVLGNFGRSWWHLVFCWDRIPFTEVGDDRFLGLRAVMKGIWISILVGWMALGVAGFGGKRARWFAVGFVGFVIFRSFWYYPYPRFLVTGLPMAFAAVALITEEAAKKSRGLGIFFWCLAMLWIFRGSESMWRYHKLWRHAENGQHSMRDDDELLRLRWQFAQTHFPLEGPDFCVLAASHYMRMLPSIALPEKKQREEALKSEVVALEFPWPQVCYALRPRRIVHGWPLENFWGDADYAGIFEVVPKDEHGNFLRKPRRSIEYLRDQGVRYVITGRPRVEFEGVDNFDRSWKGFSEFAGFTTLESALVRTIDTIDEKRTAATVAELKYNWPRKVRVMELRLGLWRPEMGAGSGAESRAASMTASKPAATDGERK